MMTFIKGCVYSGGSLVLRKSQVSPVIHFSENGHFSSAPYERWHAKVSSGCRGKLLP